MWWMNGLFGVAVNTFFCLTGGVKMAKYVGWLLRGGMLHWRFFGFCRLGGGAHVQ